MKKTFVLSALVLAIAGFLGTARAESPLISYHPTAADKMNLEGWIHKINYTQNEIIVRDYRGFEKRFTVLPGVVNDFKRGDKVKVQIREDRNIAGRIEKIY